MKTLFLLFMCFTLSAHAADLGESYLSVRNNAIADLAQDNTNPPLLDANEISRVALAKMGPLMRQIVGPLGIKGFPASGQSNVDTLDGSLGFGTLDGLRATSSDHRTTVVVTSEHLLRVWLAEHRNWWPNDPNNPPTDAEKAFKSNGFYTQALSNGAAAEIFGTLPLSPPPSGAAFGVVLTFAQDNIAPQPPEQIEVAVVRGSRVFLFNEKVRTRLGQIQSCTAAWQIEQSAATSLYAAFQASGGKDEALFERANKITDESESHFQACFASRLPEQRHYGDLILQAQALVDRVTSR